MAHLSTYNLYSDVRIYVQEHKKWAFSLCKNQSLKMVQ